MAIGTKRATTGTPVANDAGKQATGSNPARHDGDREAASRVVAKETDPVAAWQRVTERLSALEGPNNPVCQVTVDFTAPAVWAGVYGGAVITQGVGRFARTADGGTHPL